MIDVRRVHLLYGVGILLGLITTVYFAFFLLEDLSPTVTALLLFSGFVLLGAAGVFTRTEWLDLVYYALAAGAYLVGIWYTITRFDPSDVGVLLLLGLSSALFIGLGFLSHEGQLDIDRRTAGVAVVVVLLFGIVLLGVDVLGAQPTTDVSFEEEVTIPGQGEQALVGTVTIENEFFLSRTADTPDFHGCLYTPDREDAPITDDVPRDLVLSGGESRSFDVFVRWQAFYERGEEWERRGQLTGMETIPIESAEMCPAESDEIKLVVVERPAEPPTVD